MFKELFKKNLRVVVIVLGVMIVLGIAAIVGGKLYTDAQKDSFAKDGYVINVNPQAESHTYNFTSGKKFNKDASGNYGFTDSKGNDVKVDSDSFLFYKDNSYAALSKGVILNIPDLTSKKFINNYSVPSLMEVSASSTGYSIENKDDTVELKEALWKISDTKYIVLSNSLKVNFGKGDVREAADFVEFNYIDEGVVQIVTSDNVWQTVSPDVTIQTAEGGKIDLVDQIVEYKGVQMLLSKLVIDSDSNIELSPLETKSQVVPEFDITGSNGEDATSADSGKSGNNGKNGNKASNGYNGNVGTGGNDGNDGSEGNDGQTGEDGTDSTQDSTFTTAIPQVALEEWEVSATGITGKYVVNDEHSMMNGNLDIKIYEAGTGEEIACVDDTGSSENFEPYDRNNKFLNDVKLKPDTEYRLVVSGKYDMDGSVNSREFLSKVFYTDSLGVLIEKESVSTDKIDIKLSEKDYSAATSATLYLLTPEQAKADFDPTDNSQNYISKTIELTAKEEREETLSFDKLTSNTNYVARLVVSIGGNQYISEQAVNTETLKVTPVLSGTPTAVSNRASWAFELYGGSVTDKDDAIISYVYDVYDESGKKVRSIEVAPSKANSPTYLYIDGKTILTGNKYTFRVTALYNDNEKIVELNSKSSNEFVLVGSQLPAVSFEKANLSDGEEAVTAERIQGTITISLNGSKIDVDKLSSKPIVITMTCEGIYEKTIRITDKTQLATINDNQLKINIDEKGLNQNKVYRFDVQASVDVGDGYTTDRNIGHVVQATRSLTTIDAVWLDTNNDTNAFAVDLQLTASDAGTSLHDSVDAKILTKVVLQLYDAQDTTKMLGEEKVFTDDDPDIYKSTLTDKFITGKTEITEETFGLSSETLDGTAFVIKIQSVYDYTVATDETKYVNAGGSTVSAKLTGYSNEYTVTAATRTKTVTREAKVPNLPNMTALKDQIKAVAIYNSDAAKYGQKQDSVLPNNAIIGYTLEFKFSNSSRLARAVDLYAFKTENFDGKVTSIYENGKLLGKNDNNKISEMKRLTVSDTSYVLPKVAIIFGEGNDGTIINGTTVLYSKELGRGYHYNFAYAVEYANDPENSTSTAVYPYEHPDLVKNFTATEQSEYILQSAEADAPRVAPTYYAYPYKGVKDGSNETIKVRYAYTDYDSTLLPETNSYLTNPATSTSTPTKVSMNNPIPREEDVLANTNYWNEASYAVSRTSTTVNEYFEWYPYEYDPDVTYDDDDYRNQKRYATMSCVKDGKSALTQEQIANANISFSYDYSYLDDNILNLHLNCDDDEVFNRITAIDLIFSSIDDENKVHKRTGRITITAQSRNYNFSLSSLADVIGDGNREITIESKIYYDTGNQGWYYAMNGSNPDFGSTLFALENMGSSNQYHYYTYTDATESLGVRNSSDAMGSIFSTNYNFTSNGNQLTSAALGSITPYNDNKLSFCSLFTAGSSFATTWNMNVAQSDHTNLLLKDATNTEKTVNLVPKEIATYDLPSETTTEIKAVVPSVGAGGYDGYTNYVTLKELYIYGDDGLQDHTATLKVYTKDDNTWVKDIVLNLDEYENATTADNVFRIKTLDIPGLDKDQTYIVRMTGVVKDDEKELISSNSTTGSKWYMTLKTASKASFTDVTATPQYDAYFNKYLNIKGTLSQVTGFKLLYSIVDEEGQTIIGSDEVNSSVLPMMYEKEMTDHVKIDMGWIADDRLHYDQPYNLRIQMAQTDDQGNLMADSETGEQLYIGDDVDVPFTLPTPDQPIVFDQMWVDVDSSSTHGMSLNMEFSVTDTYKTIMTSAGNITPYYYARLYKIVDGEKTDVTPSEMKVPLTTGTSYTFKKKDIGTSEQYQLAIYTALDMNYDGIADSLESLDKNSIISLSNEEFEENKDALLLYERGAYQTPDNDGITLGEQSIGISPNDNTMVAVTYRNAVNINSIDRIEYSMTDSKGSVISGTIDNDEANPVFIYRTGGYYTLEIPKPLKDKGQYSISFRYYIKDDTSSSGYRLQSSFSDIYVY